MACILIEQLCWHHWSYNIRNTIIFCFICKNARQESSKFYSVLRNAKSLELTKYYCVNCHHSAVTMLIKQSRYDQFYFGFSSGTSKLSTKDCIEWLLDWFLGIINQPFLCRGFIKWNASVFKYFNSWVLSDISGYLMVSAKSSCCDTTANQYQALLLHFYFSSGWGGSLGRRLPLSTV